LREIKIFDTTLRDGSQMENISFSLEDKLRIALKLAEFGIHYIELGFPYSNPKDAELFRRAAKEDFGDSKMVAFGSTRHKNKKADEDSNLIALVNSKADAVCIVGKSWDFHVEKVLETTLEENLDIIFESVRFIKAHFPEVIYDAEHFFDACKVNPEYAMKTILAAQEGGADWISLCDTNGGCLPFETSEIIKKVLPQLKVRVGIHAHNDSGCAVAQSIDAVMLGADMVQGTINGYGERCGNADLCAVIPNLVLKADVECIDVEKLKSLTALSHFVSEVANVIPDPHQPFVGQSAFAHKGGMHVSAISKDSRTFEHIRPESVGNRQRIVVSELAGRRTIIKKASEFGVDLSGDTERVDELLRLIVDLEHHGYHFEAADGSFELLLMEKTGAWKEFFKLESFRVIMEKKEDGRVETEATIKIHIGKNRIISTAEGNGPVNALDHALRNAIIQCYPNIKSIRLTDFKVRVIDSKKGTGAVVRVLIDSTDGKTTWSTIGVSENIIEASWDALEDSIKLGFMRTQNINKHK
jgi:2-isopropylmalate synthase